MNYIVMDLEWNQSAKGKQFSEDHFPFEIIQIGAAKVNEKLDIKKKLPPGDYNRQSGSFHKHIYRISLIIVT